MIPLSISPHRVYRMYEQNTIMNPTVKVKLKFKGKLMSQPEMAVCQ